MIIPGQTFTTMLKLLSAFHNISLYSRAMNFEALTPAGYSWYQLVCLRNKKALKHFINWSPIKPNNLKSLILEFYFGKLWLWWCYLFYPFPLKPYFAVKLSRLKRALWMKTSIAMLSRLPGCNFRGQVETDGENRKSPNPTAYCIV